MKRQWSDWSKFPDFTSLDGKHKLCRWCRKPLSPPRSAYCSSECSHEVMTRAWWANARQAVYRRDLGICQGCGLNIADLDEAINWYKDWLKRTPNSWIHPYVTDLCKAIGKAAQRWPQDMWECNHKTAIIEGGDHIDMENLETLCSKCHHEHTKGVIKRKSEKARTEKRAKSPQAELTI